MKSQRFFINNILSEVPSFEVMTDYLKAFSKFIKEDENMLNWWMDFNDIENIQTGRFVLMGLKTGYIACLNKKVIN